jgi:hypothetical protein
MILQMGNVTAAIEYYISPIRKMKNRIGNGRFPIGNFKNPIEDLT